MVTSDFSLSFLYENILELRQYSVCSLLKSVKSNWLMASRVQYREERRGVERMSLE